jgi:hypothetical protein
MSECRSPLLSIQDALAAYVREVTLMEPDSDASSKVLYDYSCEMTWVEDNQGHADREEFTTAGAASVGRNLFIELVEFAVKQNSPPPEAQLF